MNRVAIFIVFGMFWSATMPNCRGDAWKTTIETSVSVFDEDGAPLPGAIILLFFSHTEPQKERLGLSTKVFKETYDGKIPVNVEYNALAEVGIRVELEGFWTSEFGYTFKESDRMDEGHGANGHYRKEFEVVLRKKENPRPLIVKKLNWIPVPGFDQPFGLDLDKGDWVAPHGSGVHSDFIFMFHANRTSKDVFRMEMELILPGENDGLIEVPVSEDSLSTLLLGQTAPLAGYQNQFRDYFGVKPENGRLVLDSRRSQKEWRDIDGYWFRIRSEPDDQSEDGIRARYGKIHGQLQWSGRPEAPPKISFTYFLAPDHSRSLEWNGESLIPGANLQGVNKH